MGQPNTLTFNDSISCESLRIWDHSLSVSPISSHCNSSEINTRSPISESLISSPITVSEVDLDVWPKEVFVNNDGSGIGVHETVHLIKLNLDPRTILLKR